MCVCVCVCGRIRGGNIKMNVKEIGRDVEWIQLAEDTDKWQTLVNIERNFGFHKGGEILTSWATISFSRRTVLRGVLRACVRACVCRAGIALGQGLGIVLFTTASRPGLGPTQPPMQWVPGALPLGVKWPGREADHSPTSVVEVKMGGFIPTLPNTPSWRSAELKHRDKFALRFTFSYACACLCLQI
jgi:hypothetical protein